MSDLRHDAVSDRPSSRSVPGPAVEILPAHGSTRAVVLVLHGGKAVSTEPGRPRNLSVVRLVPFARAIHRASADDGVATWRLRHRYRGWNGPEASPVADARWALEEVRRRHGDVPVVLFGHSMGGRTAVRVADDPAVRTVVALAPWLPSGEPVTTVAGRRVLLAHAERDGRTSPHESRAWLDRARPLTERAVYVRVPRAGHYLLRRASVWRSIATTFVLDGLREIAPSTPSVRGAGPDLLAEVAAGATMLRA
jgi:pimeloyl-ACP methyl ester carboxylesterase